MVSEVIRDVQVSLNASHHSELRVQPHGSLHVRQLLERHGVDAHGAQQLRLSWRWAPHGFSAQHKLRERTHGLIRLMRDFETLRTTKQPLP
jgi:hypothetical protein